MSTNKTVKKTFGDIVTRGRPSIAANFPGARELDGAVIIPISEIVPNLYQVRQYFDEEALSELSEDIKLRGILEPLIVRMTADKHYQIVAGERRYRAAQMVGLTEVPVIVRMMDDKEARFAMLAENLQRSDLDPRDEQNFFQQLQNDFNLSLTEIAQLVNKSRSYVSQVVSGKSPRLLSTVGVSRETDSDKSNNTSDSNEMLPDSQTLKKSNRNTAVKTTFNPAIYRRVSEFFDNTLAVVKSNPDQKTVEQIQESIADAEAKIAQLKKELSTLSNKE